MVKNRLTVVSLLCNDPQRNMWSCTYACYLALGYPHLALSRRLFDGLKYLLMSCLYSSHVYNWKQVLNDFDTASFSQLGTTKVCFCSDVWETAFSGTLPTSLSVDYSDVNHCRELTGPFIIINVYFNPLKWQKGSLQKQPTWDERQMWGESPGRCLQRSNKKLELQTP